MCCAAAIVKQYGETIFLLSSEGDAEHSGLLWQIGSVILKGLGLKPPPPGKYRSTNRNQDWRFVRTVMLTKADLTVLSALVEVIMCSAKHRPDRK